MYSIEQIEKLLDGRNLEIQMKSGRYWAIRRNGQTKRWKKDPTRFRIPIKFGLKFCGAIEDTDLERYGIREIK